MQEQPLSKRPQVTELNTRDQAQREQSPWKNELAEEGIQRWCVVVGVTSEVMSSPSLDGGKHSIPYQKAEPPL